MMEPALADGLTEGARGLGLELTDSQTGLLLRYADLIARWGRVYNLTALREPNELLTHHLLDSLAAVPPLRRLTGGAAVRVLDAGSGAGARRAASERCRAYFTWSVDTMPLA